MVKILTQIDKNPWILRSSRRMTIWLYILILSSPGNCFAANLDHVKINFLKGNYNEVVSGGSEQAPDELNYIIGLSYLKLGKPQNAKPYFEKVVQRGKGDLRDAADLGLGDAFFIQGDLENARTVYKSILAANGRTKLKAIICSRLSQVAKRDGNNQLAREYLNVIKSGFPLCLELRQGDIGGVKAWDNGRRDSSASSLIQNDEGMDAGYTVQVGYFSSSYNASKLKDKLIAKGYPAFVEGSSEAYRVRVGRFRNSHDAEKLESKLAKDGFPTKICSQ